MRLTFKQIQQLDVDWPKLFWPALVALVLLGGLFQLSGHSPWVAVGGVVVILAIVTPIHSRRLRRRIAECEAQAPDEAPPK